VRTAEEWTQKPQGRNAALVLRWRNGSTNNAGRINPGLAGLGRVGANLIIDGEAAVATTLGRLGLSGSAGDTADGGTGRSGSTRSNCSA
jgi:hypothetical protein